MKVPVVIQHDAMQCGIAALAIVAAHYGKRYSLTDIERICHATNQGVSLKAIADAASALGMKTVAGRAGIATLADAELPAILHWNQNHFVVLFKVKRNRRFVISDPAKGVVEYDEKEFAEHWLSTASEQGDKGIVMFLAPTEDFFSRDSRDTADGRVGRRSFRFLSGYLRKYRAYFLQILLGLLLGCLLQLAMPFLTQAIVDVGIKRQDIGIVWLILLGELMIVIGRAATDFIRRWLLMHISVRINISLVSDFFIKLLRLPMSFFDTKLLGDIMQRMGDHGRVQSFLTGQTLNILFSALSFIVFGVVLLIYDPLIFAVFIAGSAIYGIWTAAFLKRRKVIDYELFERQAANQNKTYQFITSMQEIKLQDCQRRRRWEWEDAQADLFEAQLKSLRLQQTQEAGSIFINEVKNIVITVLAATAVINGRMTLGAMLAVQYIIGQLNSPISQFMNFIYSVQDVRISLERINEIHDAKEEGEDRRNDDISPRRHFDGDRDITMTDVTFRYDPHAIDPTLDGINLNIPQGKVTAIVGASGSGKTTLVKLMLGYYPVETGRLAVAGADIDEYDLPWWRRQCGAVMQDGVIFSESIARNIAVGDGEIDVERLESAARTACIHDYVMTLPLRYNTMIGREGTGLSQGQKQRILIARAVYKDPAYIFLDEATNSLDAKNERAIVDNLAEFYQGRTVVVVAHRLSTVRNSDQIIVVDKGRIAETGNHHTLIAAKGLYYNLVKDQLELGT